MLGALGLHGSVSRAEVSVSIHHNPSNLARSEFKCEPIARPARVPVSERPRWSVLDGAADPNSGPLSVLTDGLLPGEADAPSENFFFKAGSPGGKLLLDLGSTTEIKEIKSFSWHPTSRAAQVYTLYASDGLTAGFNPRSVVGANPGEQGWKRIAEIDTRSASAEEGGQFAVRVFDTAGRMGLYRYLLLEVRPAETRDAFGNTFYSEIEVVTAKTPLAAGGQTSCNASIRAGAAVIHIDSCDTPELQDWANRVLSPVVRDWYPKICALLPGKDFTPAREVRIRFDPRMEGVAATGGTQVNCAAAWFRANLRGEAAGSVVHELVHVVQQYEIGPRAGTGAEPAPGWLVEGIADYIRWFVYEPQSHGADKVWIKRVPPTEIRYDAGYRLSANFLDWVVANYDSGIVRKLNAALRDGTYRKELWKNFTGHDLDELGEKWRQQLLSRSQQAK